MGGGSLAEGHRQRAGARSAPIAVIADIADILPQKAKTGLSGGPGIAVIAVIARDRKSKTYTVTQRHGATGKTEDREIWRSDDRKG